MGFLSNIKDALTGGDPKSHVTSTASSSSTGSSASDQFASGSSFGRTNQGIAFEDMFRQLYGSAGGAAGTVSAPSLQQQADQLFTAGSSFLETLRGPSEQGGRLADSGVADEQVDLLGRDLSRFFDETLNPAITGSSVAAGQLGGGRQGVAQGQAIRGLTEEFARGATGIRAADVARRDTLAAGADQYRLGASQLGLGSLGGLQTIGQQGATSGLLPYQILSQILGGPTTLTQAETGSADVASSVSRAYQQSNASSTGYQLVPDEGLLDMYQQFNDSGGIFGWLGI